MLYSKTLKTFYVKYYLDLKMNEYMKRSDPGNHVPAIVSILDQDKKANIELGQAFFEDTEDKNNIYDCAMLATTSRGRKFMALLCMQSEIPKEYKQNTKFLKWLGADLDS